ncbi:Uncharacterised protein [Mycobacteroides abscessus subsp. abscessus]|nr:Uncharacterised protein [Mycobacteroides abscessus subsp. abscessus]
MENHHWKKRGANKGFYDKQIRQVNTDPALPDKTVKNIFLRYTYPQEMERLLESCRLEIIQVYGGWDKRALTARSESLVYVCKLAEEEA